MGTVAFYTVAFHHSVSRVVWGRHEKRKKRCQKHPEGEGLMLVGVHHGYLIKLELGLRLAIVNEFKTLSLYGQLWTTCIQ